ncbi:unnamed protein product [Gordionus sp. m RMFG-2023]
MQEKNNFINNNEDLQQNQDLFEDVPLYLYSLPERWPPLGGNSPPMNERENFKTIAFAEEEKHSNISGKYLPSKSLDILNLKKLEKEHEKLNNSLLSLTTHFAQVQFRLKQILQASPNDRDGLLKDLEEFAFKGCIDFSSFKDTLGHYSSHESLLSKEVVKEDLNIKITTNRHQPLSDIDLKEKEISKYKILHQKEKQKHLIIQLKSQLQELENYAYESGTISELPQNVLVEKQKLLLQELNKKMNLRYENIGKMSVTDLKQTVDTAINDLVNPVEIKERLVIQLKTQIIDLERFVDYLQTSESPNNLDQVNSICTCVCPKHHSQGSNGPGFQNNHNHHHPSSLLSKAINMLGLFLLSFIDCNDHNNNTFNHHFRFAGSPNNNPPYFDSEKFSAGGNSLMMVMIPSLGRSMPQGIHWGNIRADLEMSLQTLINLCLRKRKNLLTQSYYDGTNVACKIDSDSDYTTNDEDDLEEDDTDNESFNLLWDEHVLHCVRKDFAPRLLELLHHGYINHNKRSSSSIITSYLPCFAINSNSSHNSEDGKHQRSSFFNFGKEEPHFWDAILNYYEIKGGPQFNQSAPRKLSRSFDLDIVGHTRITPKSKLLSAINDIILAHQHLKRSKDAHYKAFISHALNQKLLVPWLRLILRSRYIVDNFYQSWSYLAKTGFLDTFQSLEKLNDIEFHLPVDLAIFHLKHMKDAF